MTDILLKIKAIDDKKEKIEEEYKQIKKEFETYITNENIPLSDRWSLFKESPDELNNHSSYLISASTEGLSYILNNWFDAPEVYGRGKKISTKEIFSRVFSNDKLSYDPAYSDENEIKLCKEAMEEILRRNLGSFCWDW